MTIARPLLIALLFASAALAGCGKTGDLEQPAPLFGAKAKADYDSRRAEAAAARAQDAATRRSQQQSGTPLDPTYGPPTQAPYAPPLVGRTDPFGPAPQTPGAGSSTAPDQ
jgi:predicted small lipoprotein YifL